DVLGPDQAAFEEPGLEHLRIGIVCDRVVEQPALERHADAIGCGVTLAATPPSFGAVEGREQRATDEGRPGCHGRELRRRSARRRERSATTLTATRSLAL